SFVFRNRASETEDAISPHVVAYHPTRVVNVCSEFELRAIFYIGFTTRRSINERNHTCPTAASSWYRARDHSERSARRYGRRGAHHEDRYHQCRITHLRRHDVRDGRRVREATRHSLR